VSKVTQPEREEIMSNYYQNMTRLLTITESKESLDFYKFSIEHSKDTGIITQREYLSLMTQTAEQETKLTSPANFEINQTYQTRSICDHECIYEITTISRTDKTLTYNYDSKIRRSKIKTDSLGNEYITPDNYSMAPVFRAERKVAA
jgi:hypothetical protein